MDIKYGGIMKNKLIYVADDEQNIRDLIKSYLIKEGYEVEVFADGTSAYERFMSIPADMLIIDIMMPGLDGYALCREIRNSRSSRRPFFIGMPCF